MNQQTYITDEPTQQNQKRTRPLWQQLILLTGLVMIGYWLWQLFGYLRQLWRQPKLISRQVRIEQLPDTIIEAEAATIAEANVRSGLEKRKLLNGEEKLILCAGARNFREPWARDFGFAAFGLMAMGEATAVKEGLEVFFHYQRPSGQFPVKVHSTSIVNRVLHALFWREQPITEPLKPKYKSAHNTISLDGNALLITAVLHYVQQQQDDEFLQQWWPALKQAMHWLAEHEQGDDHLLHQNAYADWADSIGRSGHIIYTNVLYWKAATEMTQAAQKMGDVEAATHFGAKSAQLRQNIQSHFWDDELGYFITSRFFRNLSSAGNLMAVAWNLTTPTQATSILNKMDELHMADPVPTQVVSDPYPNKFIGIENRLAGIPTYHTSAAWLWLGGWHVIALVRHGRNERANDLFRSLSDVIVRDGIVHEVYGKNGHYLSTRWYTSEAPLTWNAAMVAYAYHILQEDAAT